MAQLVDASIAHPDGQGTGKLTTKEYYKEQMKKYQLLPNHHIPIGIDFSLSMLMRMNTGKANSQWSKSNTNNCPTHKQENEKFVKRYKSLTPNELQTAMNISCRDFMEQLSNMVPCIGCRRSVEESYRECVEKGYDAYFPFIVDSDGSLYISKFQLEAKPLCDHLLPNNYMRPIMTTFNKFINSTKPKRCTIHSLDYQRGTTISAFMDVWEWMNDSCREKVTVVNRVLMEETLKEYLKKHRFCTECRAKVLRAYGILTLEVDQVTESGYVEEMFDGIQYDSETKNFHIAPETVLVGALIGRALPEIAGGRERHAKSMETAQEEVLTCIGVCLFDRFHKIQHRFREEKRSWELIMCISTTIFRRKFESTVDEKAGMGNLDWCDKIAQEEEEKVIRKRQKKQRKKLNKQKSKEMVDPMEEIPELLDEKGVEAVETAIPDTIAEKELVHEVKTVSDGKLKKQKQKNKRKKEKQALKKLVLDSVKPSLELTPDSGYISGNNVGLSGKTTPTESTDSAFAVDCHNDNLSSDTNANQFRLFVSDLPREYNEMSMEFQAAAPSECRRLEEEVDIPEQELRLTHHYSWAVFKRANRVRIGQEWEDYILKISGRLTTRQQEAKLKNDSGINVTAQASSSQPKLTEQKKSKKFKSSKEKQQRALRRYKGKNRSRH